jgi:hypothetical protein
MMCVPNCYPVMGNVAFMRNLCNAFLCSTPFQYRNRCGLIDEKNTAEKQGEKTDAEKSDFVHWQRRFRVSIINNDCGKLLFFIMYRLPCQAILMKFTCGDKISACY